MKIFSYWEGPKSYYIEECLNSFNRSENYKIFDDTNIDIEINDVLNKKYKLLTNIAQRTDCIRVALIYKNGGFWCDADTILLNGIDEKLKKYNDKDLYCTKWDDGRILNGYFIGKKKSTILKKWLDQINNILESYDGSELPWTSFGEKILTKILDNNSTDVEFFKRELIIPINFDKFPKKFLENDEIKKYINKDSICIALNNSWMVKNKLLIDNVLNNDKNLLSSILAINKIEHSVFANIFSKNIWGSKESKSGHGSEKLFASQALEAVKYMIDNNDVKTILDAGCGDTNWISLLLQSNQNISYTGIDVVPDLIKNNINKNLPNSTFKVSALNTFNYPKVDLIICRDVLCHLPDDYIIEILKRFKNSGSKYLLSTSFSDNDINKDIKFGDWKKMYLDKSPYNMGTPEKVFDEYSIDSIQILKYKKLYLYKLG